MVKLTDLLKELDIQPGERSKMKNFLRRGSRDQINLYQNPYNVVGSVPHTIEGKGMLQRTSPPENTNKVVPFEWDEDKLSEDGEGSKIESSLLGRDFQVLDEVRKLISRLEASGYTPTEIQSFINSYLY